MLIHPNYGVSMYLRGSDLSPLFVNVCVGSIQGRIHRLWNYLLCECKVSTRVPGYHHCEMVAICFRPGGSWVHYSRPIVVFGFFSGPQDLSQIEYSHHYIPLYMTMARSIEHMMINSMINNEKASNLGAADFQKTASNLYVFIYIMCSARGIFDSIGFFCS